MTEPTRMIVLDDRDSRMMFSEGWQSVGGEDYNNRGETGATHENSLHATSTDGAKMWFSFKGNYARIMGTHDFRVDSTGVLDPNWECTLNGDIIERAPVHSSVANRRSLCSFLDLPEGDYTIGLTVKSRGRSILLDYVEYRTMATVQDEVIWASRDDSDVSYSEQWPQLNGVNRYAIMKGSSATFRFIGTGVSLYAMYSAELPHPNGEASYSMDGGPSTSFTIPGGGDTTMFNRRIFGVNDLSKQVHTIVITYTGNGDSTPLAISNFYIENGTNLRVPAPGSDTSSSGSSLGSTTSTGTPATAATSGGSSIPAPLPSGDSNVATPPDASTNKGVVVGAVVGAIAALFLLLLCIWRWRRRWIRPNAEDAVDQVITMDQQRQRTPATPVTQPAAHYDSLPSLAILTPPPHPAARTKRRLSYFVEGGTSSASGSPPPEAIYTNSRPRPSPAPPAPSGSVYHQDSGVRLPLLEAEAAIEHPPMYTVH